MSVKNILHYSVGLRIFIVVMGMGLIFFRYVKSENQAVTVFISPLFEAAASGKVGELKKLYNEGVSFNVADVPNDRDPLGNYGNTPLAFAVWNGTYQVNRQCIDFLLLHQAHTRARNVGGQSPHHWVVKIDYPGVSDDRYGLQKDLRMHVLGKLIKFGADINEKDAKSYTVLEKIVEKYDLRGVDLFLDWWGRLISPEVLHAAKERAEQYNYRDVLDRLNAHQHDLGSVYDRLDKKKVFRPVQDAHWNPSLIDKRMGMNDLHFAVINGDQVLVDACLNRGADINKACEDEYGMRPLHLAVVHYHPELVEYLLSKNANTNATNLFGDTPLHMVAWLNNSDVAKAIADILLRHGALLNTQDQEGNTLLHTLIYNNNKSLIGHIGKNYSFDFSKKNNNRESVVDLAKRLNRDAILKNIKRK